MEFLELKTGQRLRILSLYTNKTMDVVSMYWDNHLKIHFKTDIKLPIINNDTMSRRLRYYMLVEYNGDLRIIKAGRKIYQILNEYDNIKYYIENINNHALYLNVNVGMTIGYLNYEKCYITVVHDNVINDYFNSPDYKNIINSLYKYYNKYNLSKNPFLIEYLNILGMIDNKNPLLRLLKIKKLTNA